jgi:2Fe-2S ferredoxin
MSEVKFPRRPAIQIPTGSILMQALLNAGLPVASSCGGDGICSKCRVRIISGGENLSAESEHEKILREQNSIADGWRISCQTLVNGDIEIDTNYW